MLSKIQFLLSFEYKEKLTYQISSSMQGVLMELIPTDYAEELHTDGLKPYHQYVSDITEDTFIWTVCALNEEAREKILDVLMKQKSFQLKHKGIELHIIEQKLLIKSYDSLIQEYYFTNQPRDITIHFMSPASFKSQGHYVIIPDVKLIFQSLMNKYDAYSEETKVCDEVVLEHIENYCFIKKYNLKSVRFSLEGTYVSGFIGEVTIHINGPQQLVNLCNMIAAFGEYSGVGIKCAMGMGAMKIKKNGGKAR